MNQWYIAQDDGKVVRHKESGQLCTLTGFRSVVDGKYVYDTEELGEIDGDELEFCAEIE